MRSIEFSDHIYSFNVKLQGQNYSGLIGDKGIKDLINNVYNSSDSSEVLIRKQLNRLLQEKIPGVVIHDYKDGGITTIELIK